MGLSMTIKFWGVRGSIPSPGPSTVRYGGNTPCVSIDLGGDKTLILDAGTGIRELGKTLALRNTDIFILVSHIHWDHIQGFPFFIPIYQQNRTIYMFPLQDGTIFCSLIEQMDGAHFRLSPEDLPSQCHFITGNGMGFLGQQGFDVSHIAINHPGGGYGYRIENGGRWVVYLTDNELHPPHGNKATDLDEFIQFCKDAEVLIHDAQYLKQDMPQRHGWGHSLVSQACELAVAAGGKHLVLFHHDPDRTDNELDLIQEDTRSWFKTKNHTIQCTAAFEGLTLEM